MYTIYACVLVKVFLGMHVHYYNFTFNSRSLGGSETAQRGRFYTQLGPSIFLGLDRC